MGIIKRFFVFIYALAVGLLLALVATVAFHLVPESVWVSDLRAAMTDEKFFMGLGVLSLFSLYFILYALLVKPSREDPALEDEVVLVQGKEGHIKVAKDALKNLAEKEAALAYAVRDVRVDVIKSKKGDKAPFALEAGIIMLVGADISAVSKDVSDRIRRQFAKTIGITDVPIEVTINEITNAPVENQKRVV